MPRGWRTIWGSGDQRHPPEGIFQFKIGRQLELPVAGFGPESSAEGPNKSRFPGGVGAVDDVDFVVEIVNDRQTVLEPGAALDVNSLETEMFFAHDRSSFCLRSVSSRTRACSSSTSAASSLVGGGVSRSLRSF